MKLDILQLIHANPRKYTVMLKKRPEMMEWIYANSDDGDDFITRLYCALNSVSSVCSNGNRKKVKHFNVGLVGCGPAKICECTRLAISSSVSDTMANKSVDELMVANAKREATMMERYGHVYNAHRPDVQRVMHVRSIPPESLVKLQDVNWMGVEYDIKNRSLTDISRELMVFPSIVIEYCIRHGFRMDRPSYVGSVMNDVGGFIKTLGFDIQNNVTGVVTGGMVDIYIPSMRMAIDVVNVYDHSYHPNNVHCDSSRARVDKADNAAANGITLLYVTDWEWNNRRLNIESMLLSKPGASARISARKCSIVRIDTITAKQFFDNNHLQGHINASYYLGLEYQSELVMAISVGKSRFTNDGLELYRLASKLNTTIVGGGTRLLNALRSIDSGNLVSYCDRAKSNGNGYLQMGFELVGTSDPGYFWTNGTDIVSRYKTSRSMLKKWLPNFDETMSESENMYKNSFRRFWDCGNYIFKMEHL